MKSKILEYWRYILFFGTYLSILLICKSSDITMKCYGNDTFSFLAITRLWEQKYPSPVYAILGYPFANWFPGSDGGNLVLFMSVIPAFIVSILIFVIVRKLVKDSLAPWIASAAYMGCYIVFSQAVIVEVYSLLSLWIVLTYLFIVYDKPKVAMILAGICLATHYITGVVPYIIFLIGYKKIRKYWYIPLLVWAAISVPYYMNTPLLYWDVTADSTTKYSSLFIDVVRAYMYGIPSNIGNGIFETIKLLVVGFGLSLIPMYLGVRKKWKDISPLAVLFLIPIVWLAIGNFIERFVDVVPFISLVCIVIGVGVVYIERKWMKYSVLAFSIMMILISPLFFDIGTSIDTNPTTARQMITDLDDIEDGSIIVCIKLVRYDGFYISETTGGHVATIVEYHNKIEGSNLIPFNIGLMYVNSSLAKDRLLESGVNIPDGNLISERISDAPEDVQIWYYDVINSIGNANNDRDVYYYVCIDEINEEYELVEWQENI